ncbi:MAG: hypothetical protein H6813_06695 [Phycisphaeraceae bacterium]|nr:hypothetical protein [Phycisphaeraceae bacterium]MCB9848159.1 hypothetical protein [Phycisphaeraceae bacterium]
MNDKDILRKYAAPPRSNGRSRHGDGDTRDDDRQPVAESYVAMLDLVLTGGNRVALPYTTLLKVEFNPSAGITLFFPMDTVEIKGRNLESLYRSLTQHRVPSIQAASARSGEWGGDDDQQAVVTSIRCTPAG